MNDSHVRFFSYTDSVVTMTIHITYRYLQMSIHLKYTFLWGYLVTVNPQEFIYTNASVGVELYYFYQNMANESEIKPAPNGKTKAPITPPTGRISAQLLLIRFSTQQPSQWRNQRFCSPFMFCMRFNYYIVYLEQFIYFQEHNKCQPQFW